MAGRQRHLEHVSVPLRPVLQVVLDEPIGIWVGRVESREAVTALDACCGVPREETFTLVPSMSHTTPWPDEHGALERAGAVAGTLKLVASDEGWLGWGTFGTDDLCATAREGHVNRALVEPEQKRAAVGAMQCLRTGDAFCTIGPPQQALEHWIALDAAGRGTWVEPENGEFDDCPRGPDDLWRYLRQATEDH